MQRLHQSNTTDACPPLSAPRGRPSALRSPLSARAGFTLIELMMVILIISVLVSLLTVAVSSAMKNARVAEVRTEISSLEAALTDFKASFGKLPPSRITLYETAANWDAPGFAPQNARSKALIRSLWPSFDFTIARDIDQDGTIDTAEHVLEGPECLVFFLGGMRQPDDLLSATPTLSTNKALIGFSKNPANPFDVAGTNRLGPFFEFQVDRLTDATGPPIRFMEYLDPLPGQTFPYLYFSSYDGTGYRTVEAQACFNNTNADFYRQGSSTGPGWKSKSFQIISAGPDTAPGLGGFFDPDDAGSLSSDADRDNITNFHGGPLGG